jgi:hypothetical protein
MVALSLGATTVERTRWFQDRAQLNATISCQC